MMWSSIANLKENLNKMALDVHDDDDDDEELKIYGLDNGDDASVSDRRNSHSFAHSNSVLRSPVMNGIDSAYNSEIEKYKAEVKRLQESEAEVKALSVNYASLLKEKEGQISRLNQENSSLKHNLLATNAALSASRNESLKASTNNSAMLKGSGDQSSNRQHKLTTQTKSRYAGNQISNGPVSKQDGISNGITHTVQPDAFQSEMEPRHSNLQGKQKDLADLLEETNGSLAAVQSAHASQMTQLRAELEKEHNLLASIQLKLQEERQLNESFQQELKSFKMDRDRTSVEMRNTRNELDEKISEIRRLQMELNRLENEDADNVVESLKRVIATLEKENTTIKGEKSELEAALQISRNSSTDKIHPDSSETQNRQPDSNNESVNNSGSFPGKKEMELSLQKLDKDLKEAFRERDKALQELTRLKQHLLEKEYEESEKMDEDSKIIDELREKNEYQRAQILHLEKALKQSMASQEEAKLANYNEIQKSKEVIDELNRKLGNCMSTIDAKNVELLNLQTALGQYYAEIEAKERLEGDLALAREESAKLSRLLKEADQRAEVLKREKEEIAAKLSQTEKTLAEGKNRVNKLEEDNAKLRRALEQSMTRLNRMSVDSDYLVDRRIVIKLLMTYFQRNHSKEVLDLMVRMLGFSDEDKQRIGVVQQAAGKGVVRGVFGLPGRLVGGILGGSSAEVNSNAASENQSFADLWVDFLLKENEQRDRREFSEDTTGGSKEDSNGRSPNFSGVAPSVPEYRSSTAGTASSFARSNLFPSQNFSSMPSHGNLHQSRQSDSEFSTVPLTSSENTSRISRLLPKY